MIAELIEHVGVAMDVAGVAVIVLGTLLSAARAFGSHGPSRGYVGFRQNLGRTILLGLELLVAADIIRTVAVQPTLESVLVLGIIIVIRTFLSITLEVELEGRWPWRRTDAQERGSAAR